MWSRLGFWVVEGRLRRAERKRKRQWTALSTIGKIAYRRRCVRWNVFRWWREWWRFATCGGALQGSVSLRTRCALAHAACRCVAYIRAGQIFAWIALRKGWLGGESRGLLFSWLDCSAEHVSAKLCRAWIVVKFMSQKPKRCQKLQVVTKIVRHSPGCTQRGCGHDWAVHR